MAIRTQRSIVFEGLNLMLQHVHRLSLENEMPCGP
jgi:hypothetical protein